MFESFMLEKATNPNLAGVQIAQIGSSKREKLDGSLSTEFEAIKNQAQSRVPGSVQLTAMIIGKDGVGKSSFVNTILAYKQNSVQQILIDSQDRSLKFDIRQHIAVKQQDSVNQVMVVLDTPGYDPNSRQSLEGWYSSIKEEFIRRVEGSNLASRRRRSS